MAASEAQQQDHSLQNENERTPRQFEICVYFSDDFTGKIISSSSAEGFEKKHSDNESYREIRQHKLEKMASSA